MKRLSAVLVGLAVLSLLVPITLVWLWASGVVGGDAWRAVGALHFLIALILGTAAGEMSSKS